MLLEPSHPIKIYNKNRIFNQKPPKTMRNGAILTSTIAPAASFSVGEMSSKSRLIKRSNLYENKLQKSQNGEKQNSKIFRSLQVELLGWVLDGISGEVLLDIGAVEIHLRARRLKPSHGHKALERTQERPEERSVYNVLRSNLKLAKFHVSIYH